MAPGQWGRGNSNLHGILTVHWNSLRSAGSGWAGARRSSVLVTISTWLTLPRILFLFLFHFYFDTFDPCKIIYIMDR